MVVWPSKNPAQVILLEKLTMSMTMEDDIKGWTDYIERWSSKLSAEAISSSSHVKGNHVADLCYWIKYWPCTSCAKPSMMTTLSDTQFDRRKQAGVFTHRVQDIYFTSKSFKGHESADCVEQCACEAIRMKNGHEMTSETTFTEWE